MKKISALLLLFIALAFVSNAQISVMTIDSARTNNANGVPVDSGLNVQVTGIVYGPSSYPTPNGVAFMLQGNSLGIKIYSKDTYGYTVNTGDSVLVIGTLSTYHGQAEIDLTYTSNIDTIIKLGTSHINSPVIVSVIGESNESSLTQVNNVNMNIQTGWTLPHAKHDFNVNCGSIWLFIDSFMSPDLWQLAAAPTGTYNIVGFGSQYASAYPYNNGYSLQPRGMSDFHLVAGIDDMNDRLMAAVFPNPASTKLTVTFDYDKEMPYAMLIRDVTGRAVISENGNVTSGANTLVYNTTGLSNGMYILELRTTEKSLVTKISISR